MRTVCLLTTEANELMTPVHNRMPVIVGRDDWAMWLADPAENVAALLRPCASEALQAWPVDRRVSRSDEEDAGLIVPVDHG